MLKVACTDEFLHVLTAFCPHTALAMSRCTSIQIVFPWILDLALPSEVQSPGEYERARSCIAPSATIQIHEAAQIGILPPPKPRWRAGWRRSWGFLPSRQSRFRHSGRREVELVAIFLLLGVNAAHPTRPARSGGEGRRRCPTKTGCHSKAGRG